MLKEFNFIVDNKIDKPVKIGRVRHVDYYQKVASFVLSYVGSSRHHRAEGREGQYEGGPRHHQPEQLLAPSWSEYRPRFPGARLPRDGLDVLR